MPLAAGGTCWAVTGAADGQRSNGCSGADSAGTGVYYGSNAHPSVLSAQQAAAAAVGKCALVSAGDIALTDVGKVKDDWNHVMTNTKAALERIIDKAVLSSGESLDSDEMDSDRKVGNNRIILLAMQLHFDVSLQKRCWDITYEPYYFSSEND